MKLRFRTPDGTERAPLQAMSSFPEIENLIPHRSPLLLLNQVEEEFADGICCSATLRVNDAFVQGRRASSLVAIELMAQCVAAFAGMRNLRNGRPAEIGFLIGCRAVRFARPWLPLDASLRVEAHRRWGDAKVGYFDCSVTVGPELLADGALSVAVAPLLRGEGS